MGVRPTLDIHLLLIHWMLVIPCAAELAELPHWQTRPATRLPLSGWNSGSPPFPCLVAVVESCCNILLARQWVTLWRTCWIPGACYCFFVQITCFFGQSSHLLTCLSTPTVRHLLRPDIQLCHRLQDLSSAGSACTLVQLKAAHYHSQWAHSSSSSSSCSSCCWNSARPADGIPAPGSSIDRD